jgi:predicted neuraminidase
MFTHSFALALLISSASIVGRADAEARGEFIFQAGSTAFASSHASTIVELKNGDLMSAWFGGTAEGNPDVAIWASRHTSHGWSAPKEIAREPKIASWNPVLFHTRNGRLWLYYKFGPSPSQWTAARKYSNDEGVTWSAAEYLPAGIIGPVRAKPLVLPGGTIVSGSSVEAYNSWAAWIERSVDDGNTWLKIGPFIPKFDPALREPGLKKAATSTAGPQDNTHYGIIQPSVVSLGGQHLRFYARSTEQIGRICVSDSFDNGFTWTQPGTLNIPNPNSGIDAVGLRDGRVVLIYNNATSGRTPLNVAVSRDGEHFNMFLTLESQPGEYSYPAIIQTSDGSLEVTYTWNRKSIKRVHIPLADVPK